MIPCELDLTSTKFCDRKTLTYEIELPPSRKKIGIYLFDDEHFKIPYVIYTIPDSPAGNQLTAQANKNVWIVEINGEYNTTYQGAID